MRLEPPHQRVAQPGLMGAAFGGGDGVAIGVAEAVLLVLGPHHGPLDAAAIGEIDLAEKRPRRQQVALGEARREEIAEPAREMQPRLHRHALGARQRRVAAPADLDAAEQIGLGVRDPVEERRTERRVGENLGVGMKAQRRAPPVLHRPAILDRTQGQPAAVALSPQAAVARHLDLERIGQRVDDRDADAMQPARNLVRVAAEFATRVQHRQNDLERRFLGKAGMGIDRNAAAVVTHGDPAFGAELQFDAGGKPGHRLVHRIVERLGGEVMQPALVGAADIHAGAAAHRLQAFEDLDVLGGVALVELPRQIIEEVGHGLGLYGGAKPAQAGCGIPLNRW